MPRPADALEGRDLEGGWRVVRRKQTFDHNSGSTFSYGYEVENTDGRRGFLKALDFSRAHLATDPARVLEALTKAFNFERDILGHCVGLSRVVQFQADGKVLVTAGRLDGIVQYLILEWAGLGDIRDEMERRKGLTIPAILRVLHHLATGLRQLHGRGVQHQDIKPSNVLMFENGISKIGDLGRCACPSFSAPHDAADFAGDPKYAPPEVRYQHVIPDKGRRLLACDAFMLGELVAFLFCNVTTFAEVQRRLPDDLKSSVWRGPYSEILPHLQQAFAECLSDFTRDLGPKYGKIIEVIRELCEPDPEKRGHPKNRVFSQTQFSLERYVALFDFLAKRAEMGMWP